MGAVTDCCTTALKSEAGWYYFCYIGVAGLLLLLLRGLRPG